jgi:hypothetical protein
MDLNFRLEKLYTVENNDILMANADAIDVMMKVGKKIGDSKTFCL